MATMEEKRIDLNVSFEEKEDAKKLGAKWDVENKTWYVVTTKDSIKKFRKWISYPTFKANGFYLIKSKNKCYSCLKYSTVFGFVLPKSHLEYDDEYETWRQGRSFIAPYFISHLSESAENTITSIAKNYKQSYSKTMNSRYWMNHCDNCGAKQGDFFMYAEPGGAFHPDSYDFYQKIIRIYIDTPIECNGDSLHFNLNFHKIPNESLNQFKLTGKGKILERNNAHNNITKNTFLNIFSFLKNKLNI